MVSQDSTESEGLRRRIRAYLIVFIVGLVLSGITAFPLTWEINLLARFLGIESGVAPESYANPVVRWIATVRGGVTGSDAQYPFLAYGTDWLAFGHIVIAVFFIGPLLDPVRNIWVLRAGQIACVLVIPLALICGPLRGIPLWWQMIDCSFGVLGILPLLLCIREVKRLETAINAT